MKLVGRGVSSCLLTLVLMLSVVANQTSSATLTGRVVDPNGAAIFGANVEATNIDTNVTYSSETHADGLFVISNLAPGRYRIFVRQQGFQTIVKPEVELHVQDVLSLNFSMQVGSITQSVTVEGGTSLAQTEPVAVGTLVDRQFVENLPLNGRSFQSLITLTPGVVLTKTTISGQGQFSVDGQRPNSNYFIVDGVSANIGVTPGTNAGQSIAGNLPGFSASGGTNNLVSVDALQEFKVLTSSFSPEFGRTPGAQVSIVTRSGGNQFSGTVFDYLRNDVFDSNDWFANQKGLKKPALRQNDFGGVLGGPIVKDRTFFFFSYEGLRLRLPQTGIKPVPSVASRQSAPSAIQPFLNVFPLPNGRDLGNGFAEVAATFSSPANLNATSIRVDHTLNSAMRGFVRYNGAPSDSSDRGIGSFSLNSLAVNRFNTETLTGGLTITTAHLSNDFKANYSWNRGVSLDFLDDFAGAIVPANSVLFPGGQTPDDSFVRVTFAGANAAGFQLGELIFNVQRQVNLVDTLSVVRSSHEMKVGVDYRRLFPIFDSARYNETIQFNGISGALTGKASLVAIGAFAGRRYPVFLNLSFFAQDVWRVRPRLTLTYGLRWEINPAPSESKGNDPFAVNSLDNLSALAFEPRGTPLFETTYKNIAPRVGLAYQLSQRRGMETVLRGGFGVFYDLGNGQSAGQFGTGFPNLASRIISTPGGVPLPLDAASAAPPAFNLNPPFGFISGVIDPKIQLPYTYQFNVTVEQSLGSKQVITAQYVGAIGRRLTRQELIQNPNTSFTSLTVTRGTATSDYHALQVQFQRRLLAGLQALASYTWAHSIDDVSTDTTFESPITRIDLSKERGASDFDVRQAFNAAISYDIPALREKSIFKSLLEDFSLETIVTARSALPVNVTTGGNAIGGFAGTLSVSRPDLLPNVPLFIHSSAAAGGKIINKAAFQVPVGRQGSLGRNVLRGFPMWQADVSLRRKFNITERLKTQLRFEVFNIFNHPNFGDPGAGGNGTNTLSSPLFGQSTNMLGRSLGSGGVSGGFSPLYQVGGPRSMQLSLKFLF